LTNLIFGTSGWVYKEWVGPFYEKAEKMFSYYARFFNTAEINSTFYHYPSKASIQGLVRTSPSNFIFSAKLPKLITHEKHLDPKLEIKTDLNHFLELFDPLAARNKLGCILIQLPPSFAYERDYENLEAFLGMLPDGYEFAVEFRHHSWMRDDTWKLLRKMGVAYCVVDEPLLPPEVHITSDFAYFRWHGRGSRPWYDYRYSEEELREWIPRIEGAKGKIAKIYGYFNNHYHGYAVENCIEVLEMLNAVKPEHQIIKERIVKHNQLKKPPRSEKKLGDFGLGDSTQPVADLVLRLTDQARFERGVKIKDNEIVIEKQSEKAITAKIRDYTIKIDLEEKVLQHNCDDWRKRLGIKRLCKHMAKLFLTLPPDPSRKVLHDIIENKGSWRFQLYQEQED